MTLKKDSTYKVAALSLVFTIALALSLITSSNAFAAITKDTKTVDGLTATLTVTPKMADLLVIDADTKEAVRDALIKVTVVYSNGRTITKDLMGMQMGDIYSYMNSVDMSRKGAYTFRVMVKANDKTVHLEFKGEVK